METLQILMSTYPRYNPSMNTYLDGNYFEEVLSCYQGLVRSPICVRLNKTLMSEQKGKVWKHEHQVIVKQDPVPPEPQNRHAP